jgi:hypothetical protein
VCPITDYVDTVMSNKPFCHNKPRKLAEYVELSKINKACNVHTTNTSRHICVTIVIAKQ